MKNNSTIMKIGTIIILVVSLMVFIILSFEEEKKSAKKQSNNDFVEVSDYQLYFFISKNIKLFIADSSSTSVYSKLYKNYIESNNISTNNLLKSLNISDEYNYEIKNMYKYDLRDDFNIYYVNGDIYHEYDQTIVKENSMYLVYIDLKNTTIAIEPIESFDKKNIIKNIDKDLTIEKNNYNTYTSISIVKKRDICVIYLSDYLVRLYDDRASITTNISSAKEMEEKSLERKFSTKIKNCTSDKNEDGEFNTYYIEDVNGNRYRFVEKSIMNYVVTILN